MLHLLRLFRYKAHAALFIMNLTGYIMDVINGDMRGLKSTTGASEFFHDSYFT